MVGECPTGWIPGQGLNKSGSFHKCHRAVTEPREQLRIADVRDDQRGIGLASLGHRLDPMICTGIRLEAKICITRDPVLEMHMQARLRVRLMGVGVQEGSKKLEDQKEERNKGACRLSQHGRHAKQLVRPGPGIGYNQCPARYVNQTHSLAREN